MVTVLPQSSHTSCLVPCTFTFFQNLKSTLQAAVTSPKKHLTQRSVSVSEVYLRQEHRHFFHTWATLTNIACGQEIEIMYFKKRRKLWRNAIFVSLFLLRCHIVHISHQTTIIPPIQRDHIISTNRKFVLVWLKWSGTTEGVKTGKRQCKIQSESLALVIVSGMLIKKPW